MPQDDWPRGSAAQSTTWRSNSCTPHEDHTTTRAVAIFSNFSKITIYS
jgi:hypothetical protein